LNILCADFEHLFETGTYIGQLALQHDNNLKWVSDSSVQRLSRLTHIVIVLSFLVCLRAIRFGVLRLGECLQPGDALVQGGKVLLNHVCQFGYFNRSIVEESLPFRHYFLVRMLSF
jgi:hypothetical protein